MLLNNAISAGVGFIPLVGDVILANYKANSRNAALLEEYLRIRGEEFLKVLSFLLFVNRTLYLDRPNAVERRTLRI